MTKPTMGEWAEAADLKRLQRRVKSLTAANRCLSEELHDARNLSRLVETCAGAKAQPPAWTVEVKAKFEHGVPSLALSDLHWGEIVEPESIGGVNAYSEAIAKRRLAHVFEKTVVLLRDLLRDADYPGIIVPMLGDMMTGWIHEDLEAAQWEPYADQVLNLRDQIIGGLDLLKREFGNVYVPCVVGNHGRFYKRPRAKRGVEDNWDYLLYRLVADHYAGDAAVTVEVPRALDWIYGVYGTRYLIHHGHQYRGGAGIAGPLTPIAIGGQRRRRRQNQISEPYDVEVFGHFHTTAQGQSSEYLCNGCLVGYNEYASQGIFPIETPRQLLWLTHPKHGITIRMDVLAEPERKPKRSEKWLEV